MSYSPAFKRWWRFCRDNQADIFEPTRNQLLSFFTSEFESGLAYNSVNCSRAAVSLLTNGAHAGDPLLNRFFKGCANLRPPLPRYELTWDPQLVLTHLREKPNEELSLAALSQKLLLLLALATGQRLQTLASIEIDNIWFEQEAAFIKIPARLKTSAIGRSQPILTLPFFPESNVCPAKTLEVFLARTAPMRASVRRLFLTLRPPARPVGTQTLARWARFTLRESGVEARFAAHSMRHASAAKRGGASLATIFHAAGWTANSSAFATFYDRPVASSKSAYAKAVFSQS